MLYEDRWRRILGPRDFKGWTLHIKGNRAYMIAAHSLPVCITLWLMFKVRVYRKLWVDHHLVGTVYSVKIRYHGRSAPRA